MLTLKIPDTEEYNEYTGEFTSIRGQTINMEHSLISISKWESKWNKPFLGKEEKTEEEILDYMSCMCLNPVNPAIFRNLGSSAIRTIKDYIDSPMTATKFSNNRPGHRSNETVTSELIYYWMIALNIPMECQKWHINRLLTLIQVCNIKNTPPKKMSKKDVMNQNRSLNQARRMASGSRG